MKKVRRVNYGVLTGVFLTFLVAFFWAWLFYVTQPATECNTYKTHEIIEDIEIRFASHRGSDKLYFLSRNHCYMLDTGWSNKDKTNELAKSILPSKEFTVTVWKHLPKSILDTKGKSVYVYQVTDLRSYQTIYWDITTHNAFQKSERMVGIAIAILLSLIIAVFDVFVFLGTNRQITARKIRRRAKTGDGSVSSPE